MVKSESWAISAGRGERISRGEAMSGEAVDAVTMTVARRVS